VPPASTSPRAEGNASAAYRSRSVASGSARKADLYVLEHPAACARGSRVELERGHHRSSDGTYAFEPIVVHACEHVAKRGTGENLRNCRLFVQAARGSAPSPIEGQARAIRFDGSNTNAGASASRQPVETNGTRCREPMNLLVNATIRAARRGSQRVDSAFTCSDVEEPQQFFSLSAATHGLNCPICDILRLCPKATGDKC
jgi:hypothetical protein